MQNQRVRCGPVKHKENFNLFAKLVPEPANSRFRVGIIPVTHGMPLVRAPYRFEDLGMDDCVVIAGKTSGGFHDKTI
jgi:NAD(P)H-dependent flavin oxidoreductase YrpB (nitropropane dioxygenase family)